MILTQSYNRNWPTTCVIGGGGFIGRVIIDALIQKERNVLVIGRKRLSMPLPIGVQYMQMPFDHKALKKIFDEVDEVIDLAYDTVPQTSFQDPVNDILVNLPNAVKLFEIIAISRVSKFVWISSGGTVYGRAKEIPITEEHPTLPLSPYGITKLAIEKYAHMYYENLGMPIVCVRPSNAFGEKQRAYTGQGFIATAIASILDGKEISIFGEHGTVRDYLHVQDVAEGILAALFHGRPGEVYNIGSGIGFTNRQIVDVLIPLATEIGRDVNIKILPPRSFDVPVNILSAAKLKYETGWQSNLSFDQAIKRTWNWFLKQTHQG